MFSMSATGNVSEDLEGSLLCCEVKSPAVISCRDVSAQTEGRGTSEQDADVEDVVSEM